MQQAERHFCRPECFFGDLTLDAGFRLTAVYLNDYAAFNIEGEGSQFKNVTPIQDEWEPPTFQGNIGASYKSSDKVSFYFNSAAGQVKPRPGSLNEDLDELSIVCNLKNHPDGCLPIT